MSDVNRGHKRRIRTLRGPVALKRLRTAKLKAEQEQRAKERPVYSESALKLFPSLKMTPTEVTKDFIDVFYDLDVFALVLSKLTLKQIANTICAVNKHFRQLLFSDVMNTFWHSSYDRLVSPEIKQLTLEKPKDKNWFQVFSEMVFPWVGQFTTHYCKPATGPLEANGYIFCRIDPLGNATWTEDFTTYGDEPDFMASNKLYGSGTLYFHRHEYGLEHVLGEVRGEETLELGQLQFEKETATAIVFSSERDVYHKETKRATYGLDVEYDFLETDGYENMAEDMYSNVAMD